MISFYKRDDLAIIGKWAYWLHCGSNYEIGFIYLILDILKRKEFGNFIQGSIFNHYLYFQHHYIFLYILFIISHISFFVSLHFIQMEWMFLAKKAQCYEFTKAKKKNHINGDF